MNYAQAEESAGKHLFSDGPAQTERVQARSKPVAIKTLFDPETGEVKGFRVTGRVRPGGKQQKMVCATLEDAQAQQEIWETQRIHGAAMARPKFTHMANQQLREAEGSVEMLKGEAVSLIEVVTAMRLALTWLRPRGQLSRSPGH